MNSMTLRDVEVISQVYFSNVFLRINILFTSCEIKWVPQSPLAMCQHWLKWWIGAAKQQAITLANVCPDIGRNMASLGHIGLKFSSQCYFIFLNSSV